MLKKITVWILLLLTSASVSLFSQPKKVGLVLSGGGALGFAHIGAIQALEESGIHPQYVAGTSMGALVGLFYADGMSAQDIVNIVNKEKLYKKSKVLPLSTNPKKTGIYSHKHIDKIISNYIPHNSFDSLPKTLYICTTNLSTQQPVIIGSGNQLKEYVLASTAIPVVFEPIFINGEAYIDGGLLNNFPASAIRDYCYILIGIDVNPVSEKKDMNEIKDVAFRTLRTLVHNASIEGRALCDFLVEMHVSDTYNEFDFKKFNELYLYGYNQMKSYIEEHPEIFYFKTQPEFLPMRSYINEEK